jgi:hypothetical protein
MFSGTILRVIAALIRKVMNEQISSFHNKVLSHILESLNRTKHININRNNRQIRERIGCFSDRQVFKIRVARGYICIPNIHFLYILEFKFLRSFITIWYILCRLLYFIASFYLLRSLVVFLPLWNFLKKNLATLFQIVYFTFVISVPTGKTE